MEQNRRVWPLSAGNRKALRSAIGALDSQYTEDRVVDRIDRAIEFYERSPDGQYDSDVVDWLRELKRLRAALEVLSRGSPTCYAGCNDIARSALAGGSHD